METDIIYNGYPILFRPTSVPSEYYAVLKDGSEASNVNLTKLFEVLMADLKKE